MARAGKPKVKGRGKAKPSTAPEAERADRVGPSAALTPIPGGSENAIVAAKVVVPPAPSSTSLLEPVVTTILDVATLREAVAREQWGEALATLLMLWRRTRDERAADAIVAIGKCAAKDRERPRARRAKDELSAWTKRAAHGDPRDLDVLLPNMALGSSSDALERLGAITRAFGADPRIGRALVALVEAPPFHAETTLPFWTEVEKAIALHADASMKARLEATRGRHRDTAIAGVLERIASVEPAPATAPLDDDEAAVLATLFEPPPAATPAMSIEEQIVELETDLHDFGKRAAKLDRAHAIAKALFGDRGPLPKRLVSDLDPIERRFVVAATALGLDTLATHGFFLNRETMNRWLGVLPQGPVDAEIRIVTEAGAATWPIWRVLSDGFHGLVSSTAVARAFATTDRAVARAALEEMLEPAMPYELWRNDSTEGGDPAQRAQRHNERKADVLARIALAIAPDGEAIATAIARAEAPAPLYARHAERCIVSSLVLLRAAHARGEEPPPAWDVLIAEGLKTSPDGRAPAITEELLRMLPPDRADAISADAAKVFRVGRVTKGMSMKPPSGPSTSEAPPASLPPTSSVRPGAWDTITFDGSLRYLAPTKRGAERAVLAIEEWERVTRATPEGETPPGPLPREELAAFFERVGGDAKAALEAARKRAVEASREPHELVVAMLERLG